MLSNVAWINPDLPDLEETAEDKLLWRGIVAFVVPLETYGGTAVLTANGVEGTEF